MWGSEHFSTIPRSSCREPTTTAAACTVRVRIYMQETSRCDIDTVMAKEMYYPNEESGIGTDISSGEDHGIRYDQSERGIAFTRQPAINESNLFSDTISTDV